MKRERKPTAKQISGRMQLIDILYIQAFVYKVQFFISEISRFVFGESSLDSLQGEVRGVLMGLLWSISNLWRIELI